MEQILTENMHMCYPSRYSMCPLDEMIPGYSEAGLRIEMELMEIMNYGTCTKSF
jgi:hypothetical protein